MTNNSLHVEFAGYPSTRVEAVALGVNRYFTGVPCKSGHVSLRMVTAWACAACHAAKCKDRMARHPGRGAAYSAKSYYKDTAKRLRLGKERREKNPEVYRARVKRYRQSNKGAVADLRRRREAAKLQRIPLWADLAAIRAIYRQAAELTKATGTRYSVDHVIPMQGKTVSGLHVETNLCVIPLLDNAKKTNKFDPNGCAI